MPKIIMSLAALTFIGAAALPLQATAAEQQPATGISKDISKAQSTDISAQRRHWRHRYGYYGPRRYWGPRYGYYRPYPYYGYYGNPYGYYRPGPFVSFGAGPFGFRFF